MNFARKVIYSVVFTYCAITSSTVFAQTCEDRAINIIEGTILRSNSFPQYLEKAEEINSKNLADISSYLELAVLIELAEKLAVFSNEEMIFKRHYDYSDFKSKCPETLEKSIKAINKNFVINFIELEYTNFINKREPKSYLDKYDAISKVNLGLSDETVFFKFKDHHDAIKYISDAVNKIVDNKSQMIKTIEEKEKNRIFIIK